MKNYSWIISAIFLVGINAGIIWNALFNQPDAPKQITQKQIEKSTQTAAIKKEIVPVKRDDLVYRTQLQLAKQGLFNETVDGVYGAETRMAIARYQRVAGLKVNGKPSEYLLSHMFISAHSLGKKIAKQKVDRSHAISAGSLSNPVRRVQIGLEELGYNPGPSDGLMGQKTREAIRQFEKDNKLEVTGKLSDALLRKLQKVTGTSSLNNS